MKREEMQARIEELERRLKEQQAENGPGGQVALEKSHEIAARYMNGGQAPEAPRQKASVSGKAVQPSARCAVTSVAARRPAARFGGSPREFVSPELGVPSQWGATFGEPERNSIRAAVQQTVTLTGWREVTFRLLEPMMAEICSSPGTPVTGAARINGERLTVKVSAVQHGGRSFRSICRSATRTATRVFRRGRKNSMP